MVNSISDFGDRLIKWWKERGRDFPWRTTNDSFHIFLAEMLLLRTRAENVVPVYQKLVKDFPTVYDLLRIDEKPLKEILSPLGLKWRTDMLLMSLRTIVEDFGGEIPTDKQKLLSLPGVGDYIASAIRVCFLSSEDSLIDTNTVRVISRVYRIKVTDSTRRSKAIRSRYSELRNSADPRSFGFSMIDLASLICKPNSPDCFHCPVAAYCLTGSGETKLKEVLPRILGIG